MQDFIKRNIPIVVIGLITIIIFVAIIIAASFTQKTQPTLEKISKEKFITDYTPTKGDTQSKVILVEFSDFQCPACKAIQPIVKQMLSKYGDRILFVYKHFPLPQHQFARQAAIATQVANAQGKFWEYGDLLFANQENLTKDDLIKYAEQLGLDIEKFKKELDDQKYAMQVDNDNAIALRLGISATPSFILNNNLISITSAEDFESQIATELTKMGITTETISPTEPTQSTQTNSSNTTTTTNNANTITIVYTESGFNPTNIKATSGQTLKWINNTKRDMKLIQLIHSYPELESTVIVKASQTYTLKLEKEGLWTYKEVNHRHYGSVFVNK